MSKKIIQICVGENIHGGGVGRICYNIGEELGKRGYNSIIISCKKYKGKNHKSYEVRCLKFPLFSSVVIPKGIEEIIKKEKPDVIISHGYSSTIPLFGYKIAKKYKIRHIFAVHSYPIEKGFRKIAMKIYDFLAKEAVKNSEIIYFSHSAKRKLKKEGKIVMFSPEKEFFKDMKKKFEYLLFVGRLDENKRAGLFVEICKELGEKGLILGKDEGEKNRIEKLAKEKGANIEIKEVSPEEMPSYYENAKCTVLCSGYEGLPLVWLESIASLTPVFTTPVGDYKEVFSLLFGEEYRKFIFKNVEEGVKKIKSYKYNEKEMKKAAERLKNNFMEKIIEAIEGGQ